MDLGEAPKWLENRPLNHLTRLEIWPIIRAVEMDGKEAPMVNAQQIRDLIQQFAQERFEAWVAQGLTVEQAHRRSIAMVAEMLIDVADDVSIETGE
jgi:hypothetical protein